MMDKLSILPTWLNTFQRFQGLKSELFLYGNVYDSYLYPMNYQTANRYDDVSFVTVNKLKDVLMLYLFSQGYEVFTYFDTVDGIELTKSETITQDLNIDNLVQVLNLPNNANALLQKARSGSIDDVVSLSRDLIKNSTMLSATVINYTSRFTADPNALEESESAIFLKILKAAQESFTFPQKNGRRNLIIFICDKLNDIPVWLLLENPLTKGIEILKPSREERKTFIEKKVKFFFEGGIATPELMKSFPDLTDNFSMIELENLIAISNQEKLPIKQIKDIVDIYKYGLRENPWEKIEYETVKNASTLLEKRVKGQANAIDKAIKIIQRSKLGMDSIDKSKPSNRPKGILFFAGPTGTGKTELAKAIAELVFSDEEAIIRFDMSEYNDSNSDVKLIGSPPGYVGYEEGGQLTDAIRKKPFSIVLFDEIEKAHPKIFDKFLQILDDGRLTDGKGETVYFSQALIIFTSNLGMYKRDRDGNRVKNIHYKNEHHQDGDSYEEIQEKMMHEIREFFTTQLGRPEILNRFGDNFVVFDFIRESVALLIIEKNIEIIKSNLAKNFNIQLSYSSSFYSEFLEQIVKENLEMGGRGIVNKIESFIKNGLSSYMFEYEKSTDCNIEMKVQNGNVIFNELEHQ